MVASDNTEDGVVRRLELFRTGAANDELADVESLASAVAASPALADRQRTLEAFDDRVRAVMPEVTTPTGLHARILDRVHSPPSAFRQASGRNRRALLGWSSVALAVVVALAGRHYFWSKPTVSLESIATEARRIYGDAFDGPNAWRPASMQDVPLASWPEGLDAANVDGSMSVTWFDREATAFRLTARKKTALVVLLPLDMFPAGFEFDQVNNSGLPVKVLAGKEMAAVVVVESEADFGQFRSQPPLIGWADPFVKPTVVALRLPRLG